MRINKIGFKIIFSMLIMLVMVCDSCMCYAKVPGLPGDSELQVTMKDDGTTGGSEESSQDGTNQDESNTSPSVQGNADLMLPDLNDSYKPTISEGQTKTIEIIAKLLNILTILGVITIVISMALMGFGSILGSASEKAAGQEKFMGIVIAALLITGGSIIAKIIISIADGI